MSTKWFGGEGTGQPQGDATSDPIGTVRRAPDGRWIAIMWPSRPHPAPWAVTDHAGSVGYEKPERIAHWPIVGAVPFTPAAGMKLKPHPQKRNAKQRGLTVLVKGDLVEPEPASDKVTATSTFTSDEMVAEAKRGFTDEQWRALPPSNQIARISSARARLESAGAVLAEEASA